MAPSKEDRNSNYSTKKWVDFIVLSSVVFFHESLIVKLTFFLNFYVTLRAKDLCSHSIYFSTKKMLVPSFRKMMVKIVQYCSISNVVSVFLTIATVSKVLLMISTTIDVQFLSINL
jgi:hypothetical protein